MLLPNSQPAFLSQLKGEIDAVLLDRPSQVGESLSLEDLPGPALKNDAPQGAFQALSSDHRMALFTSGSTGKPKKVEKSLANIDCELQSLESLWGRQAAGCVSFSTVSHQHIYGLLFQVLWPLCAGRPFNSRVYSYPSDLLQEMERFEQTSLVSSPAHLNRITRLVNLEPHRSRIRAIFSSGSPLHRAAALKIRKAAGQGVIEVFGSTETGGVAHRDQNQEPDSHLWRPFEVVEIRAQTPDGALSIRSPYVDPSAWYPTQDRVALSDDGRFSLLGRADRVVKVEGKRVSLDEIETRTVQSQWVREARALILTEARTYIGVVLVLTQRGKDKVGEGKEAELKNDLKTQLSGYFERVLLPRKWRMVEEFPVNQQGKCTQEVLSMLFAQEKNTQPTVLAVRSHQESAVEWDLSIPDTIRYFHGHFTGRPVLPGVAQVDWAAQFGTQFFRPQGQFRGLEAVKFHEFIVPNSKVKLALTYAAEKQKMSFEFSGENGKFSSGRIVFG